MSATGVVCDASVVLKWFHSSGEQEVAAARALLAAHRLGTVRAVVLDLTYYEVGNVMVTARRLTGAEVAHRLDDLRQICGAPVPLAPELRRDTAQLAALHGLTFYDAAYWAAARSLACPLATADSALLRAGAGETVTALTTRLGLAVEGG